MSSRSTQLLTAIGVAALIAIRHPIALFRAEFWAEDGITFFAQSLTMGFGTLFHPVDGYQFFVFRVIALALSVLPVLWTPYLYAVISLIIDAFTFSYFVRDGFAWLMPKRWMRAFACLLLAFGPGTGEVFLNLINSSTVLALLSFLLLIEKPFKVSWLKFAGLVLIFASAGQTILLFPLLALLAWKTRERRYLALTAFLLVTVFVNVLGNHQFGTHTGALSYSNFLRVPLTVLENLSIRYFAMPLLGGRLAAHFAVSPNLVFWGVSVAILTSAAIFLPKLKLGRERLEFMGVVLLCMLGNYALIAIGRAFNADLIRRHSGQLFWSHRYGFMAGISALLAWLIVAARLTELGTRGRVAGAALAILLGAHSIRYWRDLSPRPDTHWPERAAEIQAAFDRRAQGASNETQTVRNIVIHPVNWAFNLEIRSRASAQ